MLANVWITSLMVGMPRLLGIVWLVMNHGTLAIVQSVFDWNVYNILVFYNPLALYHMSR